MDTCVTYMYNGVGICYILCACHKHMYMHVYFCVYMGRGEFLYSLEVLPCVIQ